jgi:ABC-type nitrate/sulfonate/bicarbonate transport system permease component
VLLLAGAVGAAICYQRYSGYQAQILEFYPDGNLPDFSDLSRFEARAANLTVDGLWTEWREALKDTLGTWSPTQLRHVQDHSESAYRWFLGYAIAAGVGVLLTLVGIFSTFKSSGKAPGRSGS